MWVLSGGEQEESRAWRRAVESWFRCQGLIAVRQKTKTQCVNHFYQMLVPQSSWIQRGTLVSPVRVANDGTNYGIVLVETNAPDASKICVQTRSGIKAWRKLP